MAIRKILQLGNPALHEVASEVETDELEPTRLVADDLHDTIEIFAKKITCRSLVEWLRPRTAVDCSDFPLIRFLRRIVRGR